MTTFTPQRLDTLNWPIDPGTIALVVGGAGFTVVGLVFVAILAWKSVVRPRLRRARFL